MRLVHEVTDRLTKSSFGPLPPALLEPLEIELPLLFVLETRIQGVGSINAAVGAEIRHRVLIERAGPKADRTKGCLRKTPHQH